MDSLYLDLGKDAQWCLASSHTSHWKYHEALFEHSEGNKCCKYWKLGWPILLCHNKGSLSLGLDAELQIVGHCPHTLASLK